MLEGIIGAAAGFFTMAGPVVAYLMRVEHRLTHIEALMTIHAGKGNAS